MSFPSKPILRSGATSCVASKDKEARVSTRTNDTLWRQWNLLRLMPRSPRQSTAPDLRKALLAQGIDVSRRTVERDLQALSGRFPLLSDESSKPFGWCWAPDANFEFTPRLSVPQGIALLLARSHLRTLLPQNLMRELVPLFDVAGRELATGAWGDWHRRTAVIPTSLALLPPTIDPHVQVDVHEALVTRRQMQASYRSKGARDAKTVTVHPLGLIVRGAVQYLVCTMFDYVDVRQLALHRLSDTHVGGEPCRQPEGFDFAAYARTAGNYESKGPVRLVARFTHDAAEHLRETPLSADQTLEELGPDGHVEVRATVEFDQTLRWWIRAFGSQVEVMEPVTLREEMVGELGRTAALYES